MTASGHRVLKATAVCMTICVCSIQQSLCLSSLAAKASPAVYTANAETCSKLVFIAHQDSSCNHVSSAHKLQKVASRLHDMTLHTSHSCTAAEPDALQHPVTMFCNGVQRSALTSSTCLQKVWGHGPRGGRGRGGGGMWNLPAKVMYSAFSAMSCRALPTVLAVSVERRGLSATTLTSSCMRLHAQHDSS